MSDGTIFQIEVGVLRFTLVDKAAPGYTEAWQAPGGKSADTVTAADYDSNSATWTCQATSGALTATQNQNTVDTPATFCKAASSTPQPGETTYSLDLSFLQDPNVTQGLNRYLFQNDTAEAYVFFGMDGDNPPRMVGRCRLLAGTIGGAARTTLTADVSLPMVRKPDVEFGNASGSEVVGGGAVKSAAKPGDVFPAEPTVTAEDATNAAKLSGLGYVASPTTAWTTGQAITVGTFRFHWSGTAWAPAAALVAAQSTKAK